MKTRTKREGSLLGRLCHPVGGVRSRLEAMSSVVWVIVALLIAGCVISPPVGAPPSLVKVLADDPQAWRYGSSPDEVFNHPSLEEEVRALFGSDWSGVPGRERSAAAQEFFSKSFVLRVLLIGEWEYIAVSGCLPRACETHRGLLLIRADEEELLARLDEGGVSRYYGLGVDLAMTPLTRAVIDSAWNALGAAG